MQDRRKPAGERLVVVIYARADRDVVLPIVRELNKRGVKTWLERDLRPGEDWQQSIFEALTQAGAILAFISPSASTIDLELTAAVRARAPVFPVLIRDSDPKALKPELCGVPMLDIRNYPAAMTVPEAAEATDAAVKVAEALKAHFGELSTHETYDRRELARELAQQSRGLIRGARDSDDDKAPPTSLFVVHGHDDAFLADVTAFVRRLNVEPIVMRDAGGASLSLVQKFLEMGHAARYAVVLLSADDYGAGRFQFEEAGVGERALQFRSRQNVILELGFFYGFLGWENVFVLEKEPPKVFPNFERPSDLNGVVFDRYDATGKWRAELHRRLLTHGFRIPALEALAS